MDKNIAALLREDARTVQVVFPYDNGGLGQHDVNRQGAPKQGFPNAQRTAWEDGRPLYTYVTHLPIKVEDYVAVPAAGQIKLALVKVVDDEVLIEPNADIAYAWVIGVVDVAACDENIARNKEIEQTVGASYKARLKRSFAEEITGGIAGPARQKLQQLLGPKS